MKGSEFVFNHVQLLYHKSYKVNLNLAGSYIDSPDWTKSKKATINPINKIDNKCFQYAVTVALIYVEIKRNRQKITKIKSFINKYNWEGINFSSQKDDWRKFEKTV